MSFAAALKEGPPPPNKGPACQSSRVLRYLKPAERTAFVGMMRDERFRHVDIIDVYVNGYRKKDPQAPPLSAGALSRHRKRVYNVGTNRETCSCEPEVKS